MNNKNLIPQRRLVTGKILVGLDQLVEYEFQIKHRSYRYKTHKRIIIDSPTWIRFNGKDIWL